VHHYRKKPNQPKDKEHNVGKSGVKDENALKAHLICVYHMHELSINILAGGDGKEKL